MLSVVHQSLLICYLILGFFKPESGRLSANAARHPLHLSSTELNYNPKGSTVEVSCRIFTDDLEDILSKKYKVKADLSNTAKHKLMDEVVQKYMAEHMQFNTGGKKLQLNYLGFENDNEAVIVYLESDKLKNGKAIDATMTVLYDLFDDQINIFHVTSKGNRKSSKLNYPDKKLIFSF